MAVVKELIRTEENQSISFGNYELPQKSKVSDFAHQGDMYKVKTFKEITKLEKNGMFVYESVPGTVVTNLKVTDKETSFAVEGLEDVSITLEMEPESDYVVYVDGTNVGKMKTNLAGKLILSLEITPGQVSEIRVVRG